MDRPSDVTLPFFAYGIFRPGQLGFLQLKDLVDTMIQASRIRGTLLLRDGLPIVDPRGTGSVKGVLLHFHCESAAEAYRRIAAIEPGKHYRWVETQAQGAPANVLVGREPGKGSVPYEGKEWDVWNDPLFTSALEVVEETLSSNQEFEWNLKPLFRLQMAYLLLWSAIERYVSLRYHLGNKVTEKVKHLASEEAFRESLKKHVSGP